VKEEFNDFQLNKEDDEISNESSTNISRISKNKGEKK